MKFSNRTAVVCAVAMALTMAGGTAAAQGKADDGLALGRKMLAEDNPASAEVTQEILSLLGYRVIVANAAGSAVSSPAALDVVALPAPWVSADIGAVGIAGLARESGGTFSVAPGAGRGAVITLTLPARDAGGYLPRT